MLYCLKKSWDFLTIWGWPKNFFKFSRRLEMIHQNDQHKALHTMNASEIWHLNYIWAKIGVKVEKYFPKLWGGICPQQDSIQNEIQTYTFFLNLVLKPIWPTCSWIFKLNPIPVGLFGVSFRSGGAESALIFWTTIKWTIAII